MGVCRMIFFFTTNQSVANKAATFLDGACGYPNPESKTDRAVNIIAHSNGNMFIVPMPEGVYAPKILRYLDARDILPNGRKLDPVIDTVAEAQAKLQALKDSGVKVTDIDYFALVSSSVARAAGFVFE